MNKITLSELINQEVALVLESFRGFRLPVFKNIETPAERIKYAIDKLPLMGHGSSRTVFAIGSGKVLKTVGDYDTLQMNQKTEDEKFLSKSWGDLWRTSVKNGYLQNEAEIDLYTHPEARPILAKIFDFGGDYSWLIAESAQPLKKLSEVSEAMGIPMAFAPELLELYRDGITDNKLDLMVGMIEHSYNLEEINKVTSRNIKDGDELIIYLKQDLPEHPRFGALIHLVKELKHSIFDLNRPNQWGKTADGRIVLLDYGYTNKVRSQY